MGDGRLRGVITSEQTEIVFQALNGFQIELPSWGFANTGTRFGKFLQAAAATTLEEKFSDASEVHRWTGVCPTIALHVLWDFPQGLENVNQVQEMEVKRGLRAWSINPNVHHMNEALIEDAHNRGLKVIAWTADEPMHIHKAKTLGVDGIISNFPDRL